MSMRDRRHDRHVGRVLGAWIVVGVVIVFILAFQLPLGARLFLLLDPAAMLLLGALVTLPVTLPYAWFKDRR